MKRLALVLLAVCLAFVHCLPAALAIEGDFYLPDGTTVIGEEAFAGTQIAWAALPLGIREVHARAFMNCEKLTEADLPRTLRVIADDAFLNCGTVDAYVVRESFAEQWCASKSRIVCHSLEMINIYLTPGAAFAGTNVTLSCVELEDILGEASYQWERSTDGCQTWTACFFTGSDSQSASFTAAGEDLGAWFRCVMTDDTGTYHSLPEQLKTVSGLSITSAIVSGNSVSLNWTDCGGMGCTVLKAEGNGDFVIAAENVTDNFADLTGLQTNTAYRFKLRLNSGDGALESAAVSLTTQNYENGVKCRALLIGEVSFDPVCNRNWGDVMLMRSMLASVNGTGGSPYSAVRRKDIGYYRDIQAAIQTAFAGADEDDVSLFFIASHGNRYSQDQYAGELYLAGPQGESDYITMEELAEFLGEVPGRVVVILESCGSGAAIHEGGSGSITPKSASTPSDPFGDAAIRAFAAADRPLSLEDERLFFYEDGSPYDPLITPKTGEFRQSKYYVLTASEYLQMSWGTETEPAHNYFTKHLTDGIGLTGAMPADTDSNGIVTLKELHAYIQLHGDPETHWDNTFKKYGHQNVQVYPVNSGFELFSR